MMDLGEAASTENEAVRMKAGGSNVSGPPPSHKNVSIWDASVSTVLPEMAGIKGSSSCGRKETRSPRPCWEEGADVAAVV